MCEELQRPSIIATMMIDSMQQSPRATRAETTDVANAILDGADACMLSGETAIGEYPCEAVKMMNRIAVATEQSMIGRPPRQITRPDQDFVKEITRAVVRGAGTMAHMLGAKLVVVASHSGRTALALSQQRSFVPTIGVSTSDVTLRKMCLYWGVTPLPDAPATNVEQLIRHADQWGCENGLAQPGDRIVIVGGSHLAADAPDMVSGVHDIVIVHKVEAVT
jgi:pyruvate kinase